MFYIDTKFRSWMSRNIVMAHVGPALLIFVAFFGLTIWNASSAKKELDRKQNQILSQKMEQNNQKIESRLKTYEDILRAGKGLFGASDRVTKSEWTQFINTFELGKRYSGIQTVGYVQVVERAELKSHIESVRRNDNIKDYNIFPAGNRPVYASLRYLVTSKTDNKNRVIGTDLYTDGNRRAAMELARDSGEPVISDAAKPLRADKQSLDSALTMFMPIYSGDTTPDSVDKRRQQLSGFTLSGFLNENLLSESEASDENFGLRVYDQEINDQNLLYESPNYNEIVAAGNTLSTSETLDINNQHWKLEGNVSPDVLSGNDRARPTNVLWGGLLFSLFVAGFIYMLLLNRSRVTYQEEQRDIQAAKDELLALASHQLRTPATGVKQYLGLLRDGYAGKFSREQKKYINEAYDNNERQLETINEMLFVARANANNITLSPEVFDINALAKSSADSISELIKENDQKLIVKLPAKKTLMAADKRYLRMCLENLLNNAAKYTPEKGTIRLTLKKSSQEIIIIISDTGVGISKDDYELVFRKFSRIPNELTNKVSGSGIGLYLVKKIVDSHQGSIEFESEAGRGTTFTISLPLNQENPAKPSPSN